MMGERQGHDVVEFRALMHAHYESPWPESVERGLDVGEIEPVMADADICGWSVASLHGGLIQDDRRRLSALVDRVERSIPALPEAGRDYFKRLVNLGRSAVEFRLQATPGQE